MWNEEYLLRIHVIFISWHISTGKISFEENVTEEEETPLVMHLFIYWWILLIKYEQK